MLNFVHVRIIITQTSEVKLFMLSSTKQDKTEKRPRGRPRAYDPETALRQAAEAFWKTGYSGTSLDDISAATGMNRPSLRAAFGDKHEIYIKALNDYWELKFAALDKAFESGGNLIETLSRVYDAALSIYFSAGDQVLGCFVVGTAITEAVGDPEIQNIVAEGFHRIDAYFEARFKQARAAGELKQGADPKALALLASATMHTLAIRARAGTSRNELRKLAQKAISVMCG
jgi:TetR/AcrR family transcriptional regulator, copper-responsive repressor